MREREQLSVEDMRNEERINSAMVKYRKLLKHYKVGPDIRAIAEIAMEYSLIDDISGGEEKINQWCEEAGIKGENSEIDDEKQGADDDNRGNHRSLNPTQNQFSSPGAESLARAKSEYRRRNRAAKRYGNFAKAGRAGRRKNKN